jgi:hypothetical protein
MTKTSPTAITTPEYIVKVSSAKMPNGCRGRYEHVAVLEVDPGVSSAAAITDHCRGVRRIAWYSGRNFAGRTNRCASKKAQERAYDIARRLSVKARIATAELVDRLYSESLAERCDEI